MQKTLIRQTKCDMKPSNRTLPLVAILFFIGSSLWGCGPKTVATLVHKDPHFEVYLQQEIGKDKQPVDKGYQHPLSLSVQEIHRLLRSIQIKSQSGIFRRILSGPRPDVEPAFTDEEVGRMSPGISRALAAATPADRVAFRLKHPRGIFTPGLTTGILYAKDDRLEFILGNYWYLPPPATESPYTQVEDPLDIKNGQTVILISGPFQKLQQSDRTRLKNRWLIVDYKGLLASPSEQEPQQSPTPAGGVGIEEKLKILKNLLDQGLITEEEFQGKKKELLNQF